jgi:MraZ protein
MRDEGGGLISGSRSNPPFPFPGTAFGANSKGRKGVQTYHRAQMRPGRTKTVSRRFRGESHHKVDAKGRVSIPASFRRVLEAGDPNWKSGENPELVIVYGDHRRNFLECYTMSAIEEVDAKIDALPRGSMERKMLQRLFHGQSFPTTVDETGRLVLPAKLRQKIELENEAFFIAAGDTFQIWKTETYETVERAKEEEWLDELPEDFDPMAFLDGPPGA